MLDAWVAIVVVAFAPGLARAEAPPQTETGVHEEARQKEIRRLLDLVRAPNPTRSMKYFAIPDAMIELGRIKATEAAPDLAEKLDYLAFPPLSTSPADEAYYPALIGLVELGAPSVPAIVQAAASKERSGEYRELAKRAITYIYRNLGKKDAELATFLEEEMRKEEKNSKPIRAKRLKAILETDVEPLPPLEFPGAKGEGRSR